MAERLGPWVIDFCYLGSLITADSSCDKEVNLRIGKANDASGRLKRI